MSAIRRLLGIEEKALDASMLTWASLLGGFVAKSGSIVNIDTALQVPTVLACTRVLAEGVSQLPLKLYREDDVTGKKDVAKKHPLYKILWRKPNDFQTSFEWRESMMMHAVLAHGGFSYISRGGDGRILELVPLLPDRVRPVQDRNYQLSYELTDADGKMNILPRTSILHFRGPSWNTYAGLEMVRQAREAIGLSLATHDTLARLHSNGSRPSGVLSTEQKLQPDQLEKIKRNWQEAYAGTQNAFKTIVLDAGMKFSQMSMTPVDTQTHEARKHQIEEICRIFRVFPQMIGYSDKTSTYASAEQFFLAHVIHSLGPWIERFEQVIARDLLTDAEVDQGYYAKLRVTGLLRGDAKSRSEYYASGILNGWLVRNEARRLEDLDPIDGLDEPLVPANMLTKDQSKAQADAAVQAAKAPPAAPPSQAAADQAQQAKSIAKAIAEELGMPELETKVGRVLSLRNEGKLKQARDLIDEVVKQVDAADDGQQKKNLPDSMTEIAGGIRAVADALREKAATPPPALPRVQRFEFERDAKTGQATRVIASEV